VRLWVALREVEHPELTGQRVTASLGIGEVTMGDGFESVYARVDAALYRAQAAGRDRIIRAETVLTVPGDAAVDLAAIDVNDYGAGARA